MRLLPVILVFVLSACSSGQLLLKQQLPGGEEIIARKDYFSGIHYLYIEKKTAGRKVYSMIYDCACSGNRKNSIRKEIVAGKGKYVSWVGVTDTTGHPRFANTSIDSSRLYRPLQFQPISREETSVLEDAITKTEKPCCRYPGHSVQQVIGFVRLAGPDFTNSTPGYKVMTREELNRLQAQLESQVSSSWIHKDNGAFVTVYKDNTAIMMPPVLGGEEGLFFHSVNDMKEMMAGKQYPVKGNDSFWEHEQERVLRFPDSISYYTGRLSEMLGIEVQISRDSNYLRKLSERFTAEVNATNDKQLLYDYMTVYVGELIRQESNGQWQLSPQPAFNVYYIPVIVKGKMFCSHWGFVTGQLEMSAFQPVDIGRMLESAKQFFPNRGRSFKKI